MTIKENLSEIQSIRQVYGRFRNETRLHDIMRSAHA